MLTWDAVVGFGKTLPDVAESMWDGTPELVVHGKGFVRLLPEGGYLDGLAHHRGKNTGTGVVT